MKKFQSPHIVIWCVDFETLTTGPTVHWASGHGAMGGAAGKRSHSPLGDQPVLAQAVGALQAILDYRNDGVDRHPDRQEPPDSE